jgi:hypothetical protein
MDTPDYEGIENVVADGAPTAGRREWMGLAVLELPCLLYSMDFTVLCTWYRRVVIRSGLGRVARSDRISSPDQRQLGSHALDLRQSLRPARWRGKAK